MIQYRPLKEEEKVVEQVIVEQPKPEKIRQEICNEVWEKLQ